MKTLYLIRHAKSDRGNQFIKDIDRPLSERGYKDAYFMSELMKREGCIPDILISSPAVRAYSTALIFLKTFGWSEKRLKINEMLYAETIEIYLAEFKATANNFGSVMVFAHNPTIADVSNIFCHDSIQEFPTCAINCLEFEVESWGEISPGKGKQRFFDFPKNHEK